MRTTYCLNCNYIVSQVASRCPFCDIKFNQGDTKYYGERITWDKITADKIIKDINEEIGKDGQ